MVLRQKRIQDKIAHEDDGPSVSSEIVPLIRMG
jgi:hypothetical protein